MGFGDNEPPAIRADAFPATLHSSGGFRILVLTFVAWDVIKFSAFANGEPERRLQIDSGNIRTEFIFQPAKSGVRYTFTAQGCARAFDGSTGFCSPVSQPVSAIAATNTNSLRQFLLLSGVDLQSGVNLRRYAANNMLSLKTLMNL